MRRALLFAIVKPRPAVVDDGGDADAILTEAGDALSTEAGDNLDLE